METSAIITLLFAIIILVGAIYRKIQGKKQEDWKTNILCIAVCRICNPCMAVWHDPGRNEPGWCDGSS